MNSKQPQPSDHAFTAPSAKTRTVSVIEVANLTRVYGKGSESNNKDPHTAVDSISFEVYEGEVFGLLGTNGAGKTSTLELIEGLARPTAGTVTVLGADPHDDRRLVRPQLGIMLQSGGLPQQLSVSETMTMWQGTCSNPRNIDEVLHDVDLTHRLDTKVGALSGGEKRRLDLACALLGNPTILFLDEPTTGLDPESRRNTWELLLRLKKQGVTMMLTTHYLEEAQFLCDRIAIMHEGAIQKSGTLRELVASVNSVLKAELPGQVSSQSVQLPDFPGAVVVQEENELRIETKNLQADTLRLLTWAHDNDIELQGFAAEPAHLESVFMSVAGQHNTTEEK
ncbi:ABC transporter ATP-binding protein [Corynebacterium sp. H113]|uniref:ABC transporter ATP-binding protein n=1 Tax=Corynebacterium sp. H113 TaxID=3133419 RepID=UPI00309A0E8D